MILIYKWTDLNGNMGIIYQDALGNLLISVNGGVAVILDQQALTRLSGFFVPVADTTPIAQVDPEA